MPSLYIDEKMSGNLGYFKKYFFFNPPKYVFVNWDQTGVMFRKVDKITAPSCAIYFCQRSLF